jgi:hypothetical protein
LGLVENKDLLTRIFEATEIKAVVSIDDAYAEKFSVDEALTLYKLVPDNDVLRPILADVPNITVGDPDVTDADIRREWPNLALEIQRRIIWNLRNETGQTAELDRLDYRALTKLRALLSDTSFVLLSLQEWLKSELSTLTSKGKILLLVDQDMRNDGGGPEHGIQIIRGLLAPGSPVDKIVCALLTHEVTGNIHDISDEMADKHNLNKGRFLIIPKAVLDSDPIEFARLVKLSAINEVSQELKHRALAILREALNGAEDSLEKVNIYDLEEMVFRSSYEEGVWEPETLFRIFGIFHRARTRQSALNDAQLHDLSSKIRRLSGIPTPSSSAPTHRIWEIQHQENFDSAELVNRLHHPTDLGDIYEIGTGRYFILLAPRCDLMVRGDSGNRGEYSDLLKEVFVAEITEKCRGSASWKLEFYDQHREQYIDFKKGIVVSLYALDLCVFNDDGSAKFNIKSSPPSPLIPAWQRRFETLKKLCSKTIKKCRDLRSTPGKEQDISHLVTRATNSSLVVGTVDQANETVSYSIKRVQRLLDPRATAALNAYCRFLGRDAFDHALELPIKAANKPEASD